MSYITAVNPPFKISKSYAKIKTLDNQMTNQDKTNEILKNYFNNEYYLENQAIRNSFGKMVSTRNQTNPRYSFGKEERFSHLNKNTISYIKQLEEKNLINLNTNSNQDTESNLSKSLEIRNLNKYKNNKKNVFQTDFLYNPASPILYKFSKPPKWSFSKGEKGNKIITNKYDYYERPYDKNYEENNGNKKWDKRIIGGDIGVDQRFLDNRKYIKEASKPGPGGYNPNYNYYKYKSNNYGYMGIKTEDNKKNKGKDNDKEDEGKYYNINCQIGSDVNNYKFSNSPRFVFGTSKRDIDKKRGIEINESYLKYSAFGEQIMAQKDTRPIFSFGKQNRFNYE